VIATVSTSPTVAIRQKSFDAVQAEHAVLCLEVGKDRFRFALLDANRRCCWLEEYVFPSLLNERPIHDVLPAFFLNHPILSIGNWKQIFIAVNSPSFTLIPKALFRKEYAGSYLAFMRGSELLPNEFASAYLHKDDDCYVVFNMDHRLSDFFAAQYPLQQVTFVHQSSSVIKGSRTIDQHLMAIQNMVIYFENEFVTVVLRANRELRYCNRFGYKNPQDLTYYLLYVIAELQLDPAAINTTLFGEITPFSETFAELAAFFPHLRFGHTPATLQLTPEFDDLPDHRYLSLYGLCLLSE